MQKLRSLLGALSSVAVAAALTLTGVVLGAAPAAATGVDCKTITAYSSTGWTPRTGTNGSVEIGTAGAIVKTPAIPDQIGYRVTLAEPIPLATVSDLSYTTNKIDKPGDGVNNAAAAAFDLFLDVNGTLATLKFEPYWNLGLVAKSDDGPSSGANDGTKGDGAPDRNETHTWPVDEGRFWTTKALNDFPSEGGGGTGNKTLTYIKAKNPTAKVVGYGISQGTYNEGTITVVNNLRMKALKYCATTVWDSSKKPVAKLETGFADTCDGVTVTVKNTVPDSVAAVQVDDEEIVLLLGGTTMKAKVPGTDKPVIVKVKTADGSKEIGRHTWAKPTCAPPSNPADEKPTLPVTGANAAGIAAIGAGVILAGLIALVIARRRRTTFKA